MIHLKEISTRLFLLAAGIFMSTLVLLAQENIRKAENVKASFYSETPAENIEAYNDDGNALLDAKNGALKFVIPVEQFEFEKSLMQKHFNKNYLESNKFPEATFEGNILNWEGLPTAKKDYTIKGSLNIHGVSREIVEKASLEPAGDGLKGQSTFTVLLAEYEIKVPKLVVKKISEEIEIKIEAYFR